MAEAVTAPRKAALPALIGRMRERNARTRLAAMETRETVAQGLQVTPDGGITINGGRIAGVGRTGRVPVTRWNAFSVATYWRCVDVLSGSLGQLPLVPRAWDGRPLATDYFLPLLAQPDPDKSRFTAIKELMVGLLVDGESFALVTSRGPGGEAETVRVLAWHEAAPEYDPVTHRIRAWHVYGMRLPPDGVIHFKGLCFPGEHRPLNPIWYMERILSGAIAQDESAIETLVSGAVPVGYLKAMGTPSADQATDAKEAWADGVSGRSKAPPVLPQQIDFVPLGVNPNDLQMLPSRQWSALEVCIAMGVPPSIVGVPSSDSRTYSSALMESRGYIQTGLSHWMASVSGELSRFLPAGIEAEFSTKRFLEPSKLERAQAHKLALEGGWMDVNEVRADEGMHPRDDLPGPSELPSAQVIRQLLGVGQGEPEPEPEVGVAA